MQFSVDPSVFQDIDGLRLAVGWLELARQPRDEEAAASIAEPWAAAGRLDAEPIHSHPMLAPWRAVFRSLGLPPKDYLPSIEALARRARKGGDPLRVQPLVDAYNAISLRNLVPVGAFDLDKVRGDIRLGRSEGGEPFLPMGAQATETVGGGELCYLDDRGVLTRHFVWRQSEYAKIDERTRRLFLVAELLPIAHDRADAVLSDFAHLAAQFGGTAEVVQIDAARPATTHPIG